MRANDHTPKAAGKPGSVSSGLGSCGEGHAGYWSAPRRALRPDASHARPIPSASIGTGSIPTVCLVAMSRIRKRNARVSDGTPATPARGALIERPAGAASRPMMAALVQAPSEKVSSSLRPLSLRWPCWRPRLLVGYGPGGLRRDPLRRWWDILPFSGRQVASRPVVVGE